MRERGRYSNREGQRHREIETYIETHKEIQRER